MKAALLLLIALTTQVTGRVLEAFHSEAAITGAATVYPPAAYGLLFGILLAIATLSLIFSLFTEKLTDTYPHPGPNSGRKGSRSFMI